MEHRAVPAIALNSANNFGGYYYFSLEIGKRFHFKKWTRFPIRDKRISEVNDCGEEGQQSMTKNRMPIFEWAPGIEIEVIVEEAVYDEPPNKEIINEINNQHLVDAMIVTDDENNSELSNSDDYSSDNEEPMNGQE